MNMPILPSQTLPERISAYLRPPHIYGALCLAGAAIAAFIVVFSYLQNAQAASHAQAASAAAVLTKNAFADISTEAKSAIVIDLKTGKVLYQKNQDVQLPLASIAKVQLALTVAQVLSPDEFITIPFDTAPEGSRERLAAGQKWRVQDVVNFTLISSSNEGAEILAHAAAEDISALYPDAPGDTATLWRMNEDARALGLGNTYFLNVSGLDESFTQSGAYSSARDIARLFAYALASHPEVLASTAREGIHLRDSSGNTTEALNTNDAVPLIPGLIMGKTGFTDLAGGNLAIVFDVGLAHPVVAVVLGSSREGRFTDMRTLVDATRAAIAADL